MRHSGRQANAMLTDLNDVSSRYLNFGCDCLAIDQRSCGGHPVLDPYLALFDFDSAVDIGQAITGELQPAIRRFSHKDAFIGLQPTLVSRTKIVRHR